MFLGDLSVRGMAWLQTTVKHSGVCARCSATDHKDDTSTKTFKCVTCGKNHASYNKKCIFYKQEYNITHISVSKNVYVYVSMLAKFINRLVDMM